MQKNRMILFLVVFYASLRQYKGLIFEFYLGYGQNYTYYYFGCFTLNFFINSLQMKKEC